MTTDLCPWPLMFQGKTVRTMIDERDQSFWAHGGDVCHVLSIVNASDAVSRLLPKHKREIGIPDSTGRLQKTPFISAQGIYRLAFRSNKLEAEEFTERVVDLIEKLRRGELELRPRAQGMLEQTEHALQKRNSIAYNRHAFTEGGQEEVRRKNAQFCRYLSDKHLWPKQYQEWAKELGWLAKDRSSGQQVLRALEPWSACACSLVKNLIQMGMPEQEALIEAEKLKAFYARLLRYATPPELSESYTYRGDVIEALQYDE